MRAVCRRLGSHFDARAATWNTDTKKARAMWAADLIKSRPWFRSGGHALDFGCGTGLLSFALEPHMQRIVGLDESSGMVHAMEEDISVAGLGSKMTATCGPLEKLGRFDLIYSMLAIHHVKDCAQLLRQLASHVHPGGRLLVIDLEATQNARFFHNCSQIRGEHYEHDGLLAQDLSEWLSDAGKGEVDLMRVPFKKKLADGWDKAGEEATFQMLLASVNVRE